MSNRSRILVLGRSAESVRALGESIGNAPDFETESAVIDPLHGDPLLNLSSQPDLLVLRVNGSSAEELEALERYPAGERPPMIIVGDAATPDTMRIAMRVGARDFITEPTAREDLLAAIRKLTSEQRASQKSTGGQLVAFVNAKGGSGATFLACNVAHLSSAVSDLDTALLDVDFQFSTLPQYLDFQPRRSLLDALDVADDLDGMAIDGYLTRHDTGISVLAGARDTTLLQQELVADRFETILDLLKQRFDRVVIDVPRQIEPIPAIALERADVIVLVVQQSIPSLYDARRMYEIMTRHLAVPADRIRVVANRFRKNAPVELADIRQALNDRPPFCVPNDYRTVTQSIDMGVPLYDHSRRSAITRAVMQLERELAGGDAPEAKRLFSKFLRAN